MAGDMGNWRARLAVAGATITVPVVTVMGVGSLVEPETPDLLGLVLVPGLALLVYVLLRQRELLSMTVLAGALGGWTLGLGLRLAMFIAAEMGGGFDRSIDGTVGLVVFFALPGIVLSAVVLALRGAVSLSPRGVALISTGVFALLIAWPLRAELVERGNGWVNAATFLASAALGGLVVGRVQDAVESWWRRRGARRAAPPIDAAPPTDTAQPASS